MKLNRLEAFIFTLLRDDIPFGRMREIIRDMGANNVFNFGEKLASVQMARDFTALILATHTITDEDTSNYRPGSY